MKDKIYTGNVIIDKSNEKDWQKKLKDITKIGGDLSISSNCTLPKLTSVGGDLSIYSNCSGY